MYIVQSTGALEYTGARTPNESPGYDITLSNDEVLVTLELWGMRSTPSLPSLPGPHWLGVVAPDRVLSIGQIGLDYILLLTWIT